MQRALSIPPRIFAQRCLIALYVVSQELEHRQCIEHELNGDSLQIAASNLTHISFDAHCARNSGAQCRVMFRVVLARRGIGLIFNLLFPQITYLLAPPRCVYQKKEKKHEKQQIFSRSSNKTTSATDFSILSYVSSG